MRHDFQSRIPEFADKIKFIIGDVRDLASVKNAIHDVDYIFHAAALKQVPSCEFFPLEAVKTNVLGTDTVLTAAIDECVKSVICLSTDKAAYSVNAMGTSKAMMEKVIVAKSFTTTVTSICCTRYGNVMCSRGSVIPLWIDLGSYALPEFQRGYVWNRDQVRKLMYSLYKGYPIGGLLVWDTETNPDIARGHGPLSAGHVKLILDGQQRITSLYGIIRGKPPKFFDGNLEAFTNLYFNVEEEVFEFYAPTKMKGNMAWINISELMKAGSSNYIQQQMQADPENARHWIAHISKLNQLDNIKKTDIHVQEDSVKSRTC